MKKVILFFLLLVAFASAQASHIVGGEFELIWISGNTYRVRLIYYFDVASNPGRNPLLEEPVVRASIFQKSNNLWIRNVELSNATRERVQYTQLSCASSEVVTDKIIYTTTITMTGVQYNHPDGYYISWERCCRNYGINNIYSEDPTSPRFAGQTFYLEFPAVVRNGQPFINNSPRLFPPLSDFACPGIPYYVDFAGIDDDGDSLVYSLVTPLNTITQDAVPQVNIDQTRLGQPHPGPYPEVLWRPGFGLNNIVNSSMNLKISRDGFLTVTPTTLGLYVFAVKCKEFRNGERIGQVIRDFQMFVVELGGCPFPAYPSIVGRKLGTSSFQGNTLNVTLENTLPGNQRCVEVSITDPSTLRPDENNHENITIKAIALNFKKSLLGAIQLSGTSASISNGAAATFRICFPQCPFEENKPIEVGIVVSDDACAVPLTDTLRIVATIQPPMNQLPQFASPENITATVEEGEVLQTYTHQATDGDNNMLKYRLVPSGFNLADVGMAFNLPPSGQRLGPVTAQLTWDPKCDVYDFTTKTNFELFFIVDDFDVCLFNHPDTATFNLTIDLPGNSDPVIDNSLLALTDTLEITHKIYGAPITIDVTGTDNDTDDVIVLRGNGIGFNATKYGVTFPKKSGLSLLESQFTWPLVCNDFDLNDQDTFEFRLMVVDSTNKCGFYKADTLHLIVHVEPPDNVSPELTVTSNNPDQPIVAETLTAILGSPITVTLTGLDADIIPKDNLKLEIVEQSGNVEPAGFVFTTQDGVNPLQATFTWNPECSIFKDGIYENQYTFRFALTDDRCFNEKTDIVTLNMIVRDVDGGDEDFIPPNIFTPNGDEKNNFFAMVKVDENTGDLVNILPKDNCVGEFVSIGVYNRWGRKVYESQSRDFRWYGQDMPTGVYYYLLKYTNKEYKGTVSIQF